MGSSTSLGVCSRSPQVKCKVLVFSYCFRQSVRTRKDLPQKPIVKLSNMNMGLYIMECAEYLVDIVDYNRGNLVDNPGNSMRTDPQAPPTGGEMCGLGYLEDGATRPGQGE
uniref:Uncharacterized protein n=1 Tax=Cacopsylla melanoneura TaxID=428564 RepID=A0A8D8ZCW3_9HEMI